MKRLLIVSFIALTSMVLSGCLASTKSPDAVNCDYSKERPVWELPLACQPGN